MSKATIVLALSVVPVAVSIWKREVRWLRVLVVVGYLGASVMLILMGISQGARFGMIDDPTLLGSETRYGDAFRSGLLAAQAVVNRYRLPLLLIYVYLGVLALMPASSRRGSS